MVIVLNVVALMLVLVSCWFAMRWMARRAHRGRPLFGMGHVRRGMGAEGEPCPECNGVGARRGLGELQPCPLCEGRGVITSLPH